LNLNSDAFDPNELATDAKAHYPSGMTLLKSTIVALGLASAAAWAQDTAQSESPKRISTAEAQSHYQETCIVTGKVAQVTIREKLVYLNLDKKFPETPLAGIIFAKNTNQFGDLKKLEGKQVEVKGKIDEFKDKLQIVLTSTNQLTVIEAKKD
jgi:DNA/RNA endonuclease YhcR with UshA esterase domain